MPAKCGCCAKFISSQDAAKCSTCNVLYHRACGLLPLSGSIKPTWRCTVCKNKTSTGKADVSAADYGSGESMDTSVLSCSIQGNSMLEAASNFPTILSDFKAELHDELRLMFKKELRAELQSLKNEFQQDIQGLRTDLAQIRADLQVSVDQQDSRIKNIEKRMDDLEQKMITCGGSAVRAEVEHLKMELNDRDQQLLCNDLEITNISETNSENLHHTILLIGRKLGVTLEEKDIVSVDRIGGRQINATSATGAVEIRPRTIVVRLVRRALRDDLMRAARVRRDVNTADLGLLGPTRRFYLNERLTKTNRQLFRQARESGQRLGWQFVWTKHGRVLARHGPGDKTRPIRTAADLQQVFGLQTV